VKTTTIATPSPPKATGSNGATAEEWEAQPAAPSVTCGIDWAEDHHDVVLLDDLGGILASRRITDDASGLASLLELLARHGDREQTPIPVAIETSKGLLVACLRQHRLVYAINPMAVARYRERSTVAGRKSDLFDAKTLANILRTDRHEHRPLPRDTNLAQAITVLARAHQDAIWDRVQLQNRLRAHLRQYFPGFLLAYAGSATRIGKSDARAVLTTAPTPTAAARLNQTQLQAALRRGGRQRGIAAEAARLKELLRREQLRQPEVVEQAMGRQCEALLQQLDAAAASVSQLEAHLTEAFEAHADAAIVTSFPGLSTVSGARILAEIGDDRSRFADARGLKAYAGSAPITKSSGRARFVTRRRVKNNRLADVGYNWSLAALQSSPGARAHYDRRRTIGDQHNAAQRNLYNRFLGMLHHCLTQRTTYDEATAFPPRAAT
jgi:transposase